MKDQRGVVYLETLVAFLPVFLFFLATLQIADLSAAHILVRHAATVAARAAVVVLPDDGRFYNDEDNQQLHAFDGLRRQDIELAADRIMRANSRLDAAASNVVIGFQNPPQRPDPPKDRFGCDDGGSGEPCMSREDVLAEAFKAETAGELLDTSTQGEGDGGMREKLDALVTAKYRCLIRFFCPRDYTMVATASLLYQGARYTYEAWPDSIRSDSRPDATPAAPVSPPTPGGPAAPAEPSDPDTPSDPSTSPDDAIADQAPPTPPEASEPVANVPTIPTGSGTAPGGSIPDAPPTAAPGSSHASNTPGGSNTPGTIAHASPPAGASHSQGASANNAAASNDAQGTYPGAPTGHGPNASGPNGAVASNTGLNANGPLGPASNTAPGSTATHSSNPTSHNTGSRTPTSGARPSIVAREPSESDTPALAPPGTLAHGDTAAAEGGNGDPSQASTHGAATPAAPSGNTQHGTSTASNGRLSASNPTRGPAPTRGPPGATPDTQGVITSAIASEDGTSPTLPRSDSSNAPDSTASIIASGSNGTSHAANSDRRAPRNLADLRAQLPSELSNVPIVRDPGLTGNAVRAHYTYDARGRVTSVEIRVGPNAQPRHIADHVNTVRTMQGYQGLSGRIRLALGKLNAWIAGHPHVRPGSLAWETRQEVEKLRSIVNARIRALDGADLTEAQRTELENEREQYARQLARHEANLTQITNEAGRGYVAAENSDHSAEASETAAQVRSTLPNANTLPDEAAARLLDLPTLAALRAASASELQRLSDMLAADPQLALRLGTSPNPYGALRNTEGTDPNALSERILRQRVHAVGGTDRVIQAIMAMDSPWSSLDRLSTEDLQSLTNADAALSRARMNERPGRVNEAGLRAAIDNLDQVSGVSAEVRDRLRAALAHEHGLSDLPFLTDPGAALAVRFPAISPADMAVLTGLHRDALRALEDANEADVRDIIAHLRNPAVSPKDVEDILRSYTYKAQKAARRGTRFSPLANVGDALNNSLRNLAQVRERGFPFGFASQQQYNAFVDATREGLARRGIRGEPRVQGSAMHSQQPNDIDMEIAVTQAEFDRLAAAFRRRASSARDARELEEHIRRGKIPSAYFFPNSKPSLADEVQRFTSSESDRSTPLSVQATLIVEGSDFDLGPFL